MYLCNYLCIVFQDSISTPYRPFLDFKDRPAMMNICYLWANFYFKNEKMKVAVGFCYFHVDRE